MINHDFYTGKVFNKGNLDNLLILDIQDDYLVLASLNKSNFIICNNYFTNINGQLDWMSAIYFDSFVDLINALSKK